MKSFLLFAVSAFVLNVVAYAQGSYTLAVTNEPYTELSGDSELTYIPAEGGYYYAANFIFPVLNRGASFKAQASPVPSNGAYITPQGYAAIYESPGFENTIVLHGYYHPNFANVPGFTKVSAITEGAAGSRVVKIQWKNLALDSDTATRMNFQMWFNESDASIQYRFGPSTLVNTGGYSGMMVFNESFSTMLDAYNLSGETDNPQPVENLTDFSVIPYLNGTPANGTVYTFSPLVTGVASADASAAINVFPNPATDAVVIASKLSGQVFVYNAYGQRVDTIQTRSEKQTVNVNAWPNGIYMLRTADGAASKLLIQR